MSQSTNNIWYAVEMSSVVDGCGGTGRNRIERTILDLISRLVQQSYSKLVSCSTQLVALMEAITSGTLPIDSLEINAAIVIFFPNVSKQK